MAKKIAIISLIISVVVVALYSAFWYVYADQIKTKILNLAHDNPEYISVADVEIYGFPLQQKVKIYDAKLKIPAVALNRYQINVKEIEAKSDLFSADFKISSISDIFVQDLNGNSVGYVELNQLPEIEITLGDHVVDEFYYFDHGYRILDENKVAIYIADSSQILYKGKIDDHNKITANVKVKVEAIQGFDIIHIYQNMLQDRVIADAKLGKLMVRQNPDALNLAPAINSNLDNVEQDDVGETLGQEVMDPAPEEQELEESDNVQKVTGIDEQENADETKGDVQEADLEEENPLEMKESDDVMAKSQNLVEKLKSQKGDIEIELEYELLPNYSKEKDVLDPMIIHQKPSYSHRTIKIKKFEYNNAIYTIDVNGRLNIEKGDVLPSGAISIDVTGIDDLVGHLLIGFEDIMNQNTPKREVESLELSNPDLLVAKEKVVEAAMPKENIEPAQNPVITENNQVKEKEDIVVMNASNNPVDEENAVQVPADGEELEQKENDPYKAFLQELVENLPTLVQEISAKNQLSEGQSAVFELRREKNDANILINETPISEIFSKTQADENI